MAIRGRVGRHASTGAQCQNWADDQRTVITLLNAIPTADGGSQGALSNQVVAGIASAELSSAIKRFQKQHFAGQQTGYVDPGGPMLALLETLAARPTPDANAASHATGQWGDLKSTSVPRALRAALLANPHLSHVDVVEIVRAALADGSLSDAELDDLETIAAKSRSLLQRPKDFLQNLVVAIRSGIAKVGPYKLVSSQQKLAANMVCDFLRLRGNGRWPNLDRDAVGIGMIKRLAWPGLVRQSGASLCGPSALMSALLTDRPGTYARYAIDLYEKGEAKLGRLSVEPRERIRTYKPTWDAPDPVDWLTVASLRDSENWFFADLAGDSTATGIGTIAGSRQTRDGFRGWIGDMREGLWGATTQMEVAWWFDRAGYTDVREDANLLRHQRGTANMDEASRLYAAGYRVMLLIRSQMMTPKEQNESGGLSDGHWIGLRSIIDRSGGNVRMTVFSWGDGSYQLPQSGTLSLDQFLMNYYGYVAARP